MKGRRALLFTTLLLCLALGSAGAEAARSSATSVSGDQLSVTVHTTPELLEPGLVVLSLGISYAGEPLPNEPVLVRLQYGKRIVFETNSITNEAAITQVRLYLEQPGKPTLTVTAKEESVSTKLMVKGRAILVMGFLTSLSILVVLLLDRP
mgnify:CR=1 FL=1